MAALVTLAVAKSHLQIPQTTNDMNDDVQRKVEQASATVLGMMTTALLDPTWTADTAPAAVQANVLQLLGFLYGNRGDTAATDPRPEILHDLMRLGYRDPVVA